MDSTNHLKGLFLIIGLAAILIGCDQSVGNGPEVGKATEDPSIGRMRVAIWPEYDDPSILAIYDGKFEKAASFPIKTSFLVPKGAVISDACSLSHEGKHFCQLYKTVNKGAFDEVQLILPYPNFYLSFHTPRLDASNGPREFDYRIKTNHTIRTLEVDIQQPLRSTAFRITPTEGPAASTRDPAQSASKGFNHFLYTLEDITDGQESVFRISYEKNDPQPSVDIKYSSMSGPKTFSSPYESQRGVRAILYVVFGSGIAGIAGLLVWYLRRRRNVRAR